MLLNFRFSWGGLLLFLSLSFPTFSQNSASVQVEDYVILQNGRRFDGTVLRKLGQLDFEKIEFLRRGETEVYSPADIKSFGLGSGEFYRSLSLDGSETKQFVQMLVEGPVNLARYQGVYFAGNGTELTRLEDNSVLSKTKSASVQEAAIPYTSTLSTLMAGDCLRKIASLIRGTKLQEDELLWLFTRYYECDKSEVVFFTELQPAYKLSPSGIVSVYQTGIKSDQVVGDRKDLMTSSPIFQGYFGVKVHSLRSFPRFSADAGAAFEASSLTWESQLESPAGRFTATEEIGLSFLSFPLTINYTLARSRNKEFILGLGSGYGFSFSNSEYSIQDILYRGYEDLILQEGSFVDIKNGVVFFHGQGGVQFKLKSKQEISLLGRFRYMPSYYTAELGNNAATYHKLDLGLGLGIHF